MNSYITGEYFATPDLGYRWCVMEQSPIEGTDGFGVMPIEFFITEAEAIARATELNQGAV